MAYSVPHILQCYAQGYFLMADDEGQSLNWYASRERTVIPLDSQFRYPKSLRRALNQNRFEVAINRSFDAVVDGCANRETTWISNELKAIYRMLHRAGHAHSFETWQGDRLAGGILGITLGGVFIGESMFFNIPDGSKVAMVKLVEWLRQQNFCLFDAQMMNPHLARFGAYIIPSEVYQDLLYEGIQRPCRFAPRRPEPRLPLPCEPVRSRPHRQ